MPEFALFGIENPLLDMSAIVQESFLKKYNLKENDAILASQEHSQLYSDMIDNYHIDYVAGGAAQNTLRGAQWLLPKNSTVYVGSVGKDSNAEKLKKAAREDGLRTEYMVDETLPTGRCGVLITGIHRTLVTDLQAANSYKSSHLQRKEIWDLVENARFIYVGGYFLTVSPDSANILAKHCLESNKVFAMNLSAPFLLTFFSDAVNFLAPYWDYVFGNEAEALAYAQANSLGTESVKEIAIHISKLPKLNAKRDRIVVFTQGSDPTIVAVNGAVTEFPVVSVPVSKIVDTNGAGDAFAGGFLAGLVLGKEISQCVLAGQYVASVVIQRTGPTYPRESPDFQFS